MGGLLLGGRRRYRRRAYKRRGSYYGRIANSIMANWPNTNIIYNPRACRRSIINRMRGIPTPNYCGTFLPPNVTMPARRGWKMADTGAVTYS